MQTFNLQIFEASFTAFADQEPISAKLATSPKCEKFIGIRENWRVAPPCIKITSCVSGTERRDFTDCSALIATSLKTLSLWLISIMDEPIPL